MSGIQPKVTRQEKKQKKMTVEKSIKFDPQFTQIMNLVNKDFKTVIITASYVFKKLDEILSMLTRDIEYIITQIEYLEMKTTMSGMKNELARIIGRLDIAGKKALVKNT